MGVLSASVPQNVVRLTSTDPSADGAVATLYANGEAVGRALVEKGVATIVPEGPIPIPYPNLQGDDRGVQLTVVVDQDGFVPA